MGWVYRCAVAAVQIMVACAVAVVHVRCAAMGNCFHAKADVRMVAMVVGAYLLYGIWPELRWMLALWSLRARR
jgi:hypothetical protein